MAVILYYLRRAERNIIITYYIVMEVTAHGRRLLYRRDPTMQFLQLILSILYLGSITYILLYVCKHDITTKARKKLILVALSCHGC